MVYIKFAFCASSGRISSETAEQIGWNFARGQRSALDTVNLTLVAIAPGVLTGSW